jgi:AbrB family looped-hinge helix DNA binding protein
MEIIGTVTSKGQITIPRTIREAIGLHPGDRVSFQIDPERNVLLRKNMINPSCAGLLREYGKGITLTEDNIREAIRQGITGDSV